MPGWQLGTKGAQVELKVFVDLLCPGSQQANENLLSLLPLQSDIEGKTYNELLDIKMTAFVLPYHLHSY